MAIHETVRSIAGLIIDFKALDRKQRFNEAWQHLQSPKEGTFRDCVVFFDNAEHDLYGPGNKARREQWALFIKGFLENASDDTVERAVNEISELSPKKQQLLLGEVYATLHELPKNKSEDFGWLDRYFGAVVAVHRACGETDLKNFQKDIISSSIPRGVIEDNFPEIREERLAREASPVTINSISVREIVIARQSQEEHAADV